ncbi:MAG: autophagy protein Apg9-domain-containing protein [Linnemannia gamsii]|nr:MAG: autophagy protein Apg9-domain-containing protein [Linnemannia gamsii]
MHRHSPYSNDSTGETHDSNLDDHSASFHSYRPQDSAALSSSFLRQSTLSNNHGNPLSTSSTAVATSIGHAATATTSTTTTTTSTTTAHNPPPLMPLFTPVLQTFQSQYGSRILHQAPSDDHFQEQEDYEQEDTAQYSHQPRLSDFQNDLGHDEHDRHHHHRHRQQYHHHHGLDEDEDEDGDEDGDEEDDADTSSRRNLLYAGVGEASSSAHSSDVGGRGNSPYFQSNRPMASSPFAVNRTNNSARSGRSNPSLGRPTLDIGTDHEAPASLMIEMNQQHQEEDDSAGYWNFGDRARRRLQYKRPGMNAAELAMWKWVNVENLDNFLARVYSYYAGKGMYTILLERCLNLLTFAFVIGFATYLVGCVDYPRLRHSRHLSEVIIPQCGSKLSTGTFVVLLLFATFWIGQLTRLAYDVPEMVDMRNFYTYLLQIPDEDIQTVSWHEVAARIMKIRDNNPNTSTTATIQTTDTQRLNAHDIANRIMRKENFMIAMFDKDLIDLSIPVPMMHNRTILTRILEWSLSFCILGYVFDERGQIRKRFLKDTRRTELVEGLRRRFQFMGLATLLFSPFISIYLTLYFFFRYFEEYHKNPSSIGTRQYTPVAKWKFKEFNELPHLFEERVNASYPLAMKYINQFPKEKTILLCRFVAFISGSFAAVLALITIFDQELLLGLEITTDRTVFFYLGLFGTIMAVSRGMIPDQTESFDPETLIRGVVEHTHYMPSEWEDKLHTDEVRKRFALLFEYNAMLFLMEFMSLVLTPLMLCLSLANCSEKIVDFFREFTVHVDGIGYVCSFAVIDFKRQGNVKNGNQATGTVNERAISNESKMEKSFLNFKHNNPDWEPNDPEGSVYLSKLLKAESAQSNRHHHQHRYYPGEDAYHQPGQWGQSSAFMRPRGVGGSYYSHNEKRSSQAKSRLGRGVYNHHSEENEDDGQDSIGDHNVRDRGQGPGVKFQLSSDQRVRDRDRYQHRFDGGSGSESGGYDDHGSADDQRRRTRTQPKSGLPFTSDLGDSFVSEIGGPSNRTGPGTRRGRGQEQGQGLDDMADSLEDERESQKKGVFGLLNQIYELNNVTK